ncbi:MAG TPA: hypothetical protein V6D00_10395 [Pantanalinema sp.]
MGDTRISSAASHRLHPAPKAPSAPQPAAAAAPRVEADKLLVQGGGQAEAGLRIAKEALAFPPKPRAAAEMKPWLLDAYSRLLKAKSAQDALQNDRGESRVTGREYSEITKQIADAERKIAKLDKHDAVKKEFFATILPSAQQIIDDLAKFPPPPADNAGKGQWLAGARQELARAKAADNLMNAAWFDFGELAFEQRADAGEKLFTFESRVRSVEYALNPPSPRSTRGSAAKPGANGTEAQLFGLTKGASELANSKNPVGQVAGTLTLPIAVTLDVIDLVTRISGGSR